MGPRAVVDLCRKSRPPPGFDHRTVQPVTSRYTDYATQPTLNGLTANDWKSCYCLHAVPAVGWAGLRGGPTEQLPEVLTQHWNHRKYGAGALSCSTRERTSKIIRNFGTRPQKYSPALS